jgi:hypothetical protein
MVIISMKRKRQKIEVKIKSLKVYGKGAHEIKCQVTT